MLTLQCVSSLVITAPAMPATDHATVRYTYQTVMPRSGVLLSEAATGGTHCSSQVGND